MKTNFIITILLLFSNILLAQHQNLDKLPPKNDTLVKALVLADIGKVTEIIYIDVSGWRALALEKASPQEKFTKHKFKTVEERLKEIEKLNNPKTLTDPPPEMKEKYQKLLDTIKRIRDSANILRQQYLQKRDSIWKQDSIKESRKKLQPYPLEWFFSDFRFDGFYPLIPPLCSKFQTLPSKFRLGRVESAKSIFIQNCIRISTKNS